MEMQMDNFLNYIRSFAMFDNFFNLVGIIILCFIIFKLLNKIILTIIDFYRYKFIISIDADYDKFISILDSIINNNITDYITLNGLYDQFIGEEQEKKLRHYISNILEKQLSESFIKKLELIYNKEAIPELLAKRILTTISIYIAKNNAVKKK